MTFTNEHGILHAKAQLQILTAEFLSDQCHERAEQIAPFDEPVPSDPQLAHEFWDNMERCAQWLTVASCFDAAYRRLSGEMGLPEFAIYKLPA